MTEANDNFVNWIIKKVGINESSRLLEIGCGRGAYAINIAKQTGKIRHNFIPSGLNTD